MRIENKNLINLKKKITAYRKRTYAPLENIYGNFRKVKVFKDYVIIKK